jgi:hypothetical protein
MPTSATKLPISHTLQYFSGKHGKKQQTHYVTKILAPPCFEKYALTVVSTAVPMEPANEAAEKSARMQTVRVCSVLS